MSAQPRFWQAHSKREWANAHIHELHSHWENFLQTNFYEVLAKNHPDGLQSIRVVTSPLPPHMVLMLGDAVHNLRAALDYAISEVLSYKNRRVTFPMHETREELEASFRTKDEIVDSKTLHPGNNAAIEIATPGIGAFICDVIKPYQGSGSPLWALGKLDNTDKHRLLITVVVLRTIEVIEVIDDNGIFMNGSLIILDKSGYADVAMFEGDNLKIKSMANLLLRYLSTRLALLRTKASSQRLCKCPRRSIRRSEASTNSSLLAKPSDSPEPKSPMIRRTPPVKAALGGIARSAEA